MLPIVIVTSSEAIRAVPQSLREGGYGVGATKWEVQRTLVLPNAFAGILTGTILGRLPRHRRDRAIHPRRRVLRDVLHDRRRDLLGEVRQARTPRSPRSCTSGPVSRPQEFKISLTAAAILVLLAVTLLANLTAVLLRNHYEKRW